MTVVSTRSQIKSLHNLISLQYFCQRNGVSHHNYSAHTRMPTHSASGCYFLTLCLDYSSTYYGKTTGNITAVQPSAVDKHRSCLFHFSQWSRYEVLTDPEIVLSYKSSLGFSLASSLLTFAFNSRATMPNLKRVLIFLSLHLDYSRVPLLSSRGLIIELQLV